MIITTETTVALRCPICGKLDYHSLSLFAFANNGRQEIKCSCGAVKLSIVSKRDKFWLQVNCIYCEQVHYIPFKRRDFYSKKPIAFYCFETDLDLGFLGPHGELEKLTESLDDALESHLEQEDYFENPKIMFEILNILHDIAEEEDLYCHCGNHNIEIDILPKGIELSCGRCNSTLFVPAEKEGDLLAAKQLNNIVIPKKDFKTLG